VAKFKYMGLTLINQYYIHDEVMMREEHRLRGFENTVLRMIFGPKRDEDGLWRK
jgi:hypothetical protein